MFDNVVNKKKIIKHFYNIKTRREQLLFIEVCMYFEFIVTGFIYFVIFFFSQNI